MTAGSGIALGLSQNWGLHAAPGAASRAHALPAATGLRAIVSGSCSEATNAQVEHFRRAGGATFVVDPLAIAAGADVAAQALLWAGPRLAHAPVLIHATAQPQAVAAVQSALGVARAGTLVEQTLARVAVGLVEAGVRQLIVAGGETSGAVVQALAVRQMRIGPQIDPGVPWTWVAAAGARAEPMHVALKSGNFGTPDFFVKAYAALDAAP